MRDETGDILLAPLAESIRQKGFNIDNSFIDFYDQEDGWVGGACTPIPQDAKIPIDTAVSAKNLIQINLRPNLSQSGSSRKRSSFAQQQISSLDERLTPQRQTMQEEEVKKPGQNVATRSKRSNMINKDRPAKQARAQAEGDDDSNVRHSLNSLNLA